jgi:hypothetical protein
VLEVVVVFLVEYVFRAEIFWACLHAVLLVLNAFAGLYVAHPSVKSLVLTVLVRWQVIKRQGIKWLVMALLWFLKLGQYFMQEKGPLGSSG